MNLLTAKEFGLRCDPPITSSRVAQLIRAGKIKATMMLGQHVIEPSQVAAFSKKRVTAGWVKGRKRGKKIIKTPRKSI